MSAAGDGKFPFGGHTINATGAALVAFLSLTGPAEAASFDCSRASTAAEKAICGDPTLSRLDGEMGQAFRQALARHPDDREHLLTAQRGWIRHRNSECEGSDVGCLRRMTQRRGQALSLLARTEPVHISSNAGLNAAPETHLVETKPAGLPRHYQATVRLSGDGTAARQDEWVVNCNRGYPQVLTPDESTVEIEAYHAPALEHKTAYELWWAVCEGELRKFSPERYNLPTAIPNRVSLANPGGLLLGRCHMDGCSWFIISDRKVIAQSSEGELYQVRSRGWHSIHPDGSYEVDAPLEGGATGDGYVFCSHKRPAVLFAIDGRWYAHLLSPGARDGIVGYNESSYVTYFAACHALRIKDVYNDGITAGRLLGYQAETFGVDQWELSDLRDILTGTGR